MQKARNGRADGMPSTANVNPILRKPGDELKPEPQGSDGAIIRGVTPGRGVARSSILP